MLQSRELRKTFYRSKMISEETGRWIGRPKIANTRRMGGTGLWKALVLKADSLDSNSSSLTNCMNMG